MSTTNPLDRFKPKPEALIRKFWFPPETASEETGFRVTIRYTSPAVFGELEERIRTRFTKERKTDAPPATQRREIMNELLLHTVVKCEGVTFGKLQALIPLDADAVAKSGGLDAPVPMDPENPTNGEEGRYWLLRLLDESTAFSQWVTQISQNLSAFQNEDWRERVKNSMEGGKKATAAGPTTSSAPA